MKTRPLTVHRTRDRARELERLVQPELDTDPRFGTDPADDAEVIAVAVIDSGGVTFTAYVPSWAKGVRVDRVGFFQRAVPGRRRRLGVQYALVATENRGR